MTRRSSFVRLGDAHPALSTRMLSSIGKNDVGRRKQERPRYRSIGQAENPGYSDESMIFRRLTKIETFQGVLSCHGFFLTATLKLKLDYVCSQIL